MKEWSSYPTHQVATIFFKSRPAGKYLHQVVTSNISTDDKVVILSKYINVSVTRKGAFYQAIERDQIRKVNWYEIIRRSNELIGLLN